MLHSVAVRPGQPAQRRVDFDADTLFYLIMSRDAGHPSLPASKVRNDICRLKIEVIENREISVICQIPVMIRISVRTRRAAECSYIEVGLPTTITRAIEKGRAIARQGGRRCESILGR